MKVLLQVRAKLCYALAAILFVAAVVLIAMLGVGYVPEFAAYPVDWVVSFFPKDDTGLLLLCIVILPFFLILVPVLLIYGLIKRGKYLEKQAWKVRRRRPIRTY
jgi:hypothetical protein